MHCEPRFWVKDGWQVAQQVKLRILWTEPSRGWAFVRLQFAKRVVTDVFLYQLSKVGAATLPIPVDTPPPPPIADRDWPQDCYFVHCPVDDPVSFEATVVDKMRHVATLLRATGPLWPSGPIPESTTDDGGVVFTIWST